MDFSFLRYVKNSQIIQIFSDYLAVLLFVLRIFAACLLQFSQNYIYYSSVSTANNGSPALISPFARSRILWLSSGSVSRIGETRDGALADKNSKSSFIIGSPIFTF